MLRLTMSLMFLMMDLDGFVDDQVGATFYRLRHVIEKAEHIGPYEVMDIFARRSAQFVPQVVTEAFADDLLDVLHDIVA